MVYVYGFGFDAGSEIMNISEEFDSEDAARASAREAGFGDSTFLIVGPVVKEVCGCRRVGRRWYPGQANRTCH